MEKYLPFEYGKLYKVRDNINSDIYSIYKNIDYRQIGQKTVVGGDYNTSVISPIVISNDLYKYNFHPIAFNESQQVVVGEILLEIQEKIYGQVKLNNTYNSYGSQINFLSSDIDNTQSKIFRVEVAVETFIKDFEIVL